MPNINTELQEWEPPQYMNDAIKEMEFFKMALQDHHMEKCTKGDVEDKLDGILVMLMQLCMTMNRLIQAIDEHHIE